MAITINNKTYRNLQEQVAENANNILELADSVEQIETEVSDLVPVVANPTLEGGEASLTGLEVDGVKYVNNASITVDSAISSSSTNPVQNQVIYNALQTKQDVLTFDNVPTASSDNPVKSGGVYSALSGKQNTLTFDDAPTASSSNPVKSGGVYSALAGKQATLTFDANPTNASTNPVYSGGVYSALAGKQNTLLKFTNLTASAWTSSSEYDAYGYKCDLTCTGITASSVVEVIFDVDEALSGNYAPVCYVTDDTVRIYSKVNDSITIPVIKEV